LNSSSVKSILRWNLYLIYSGILCLLFYHLEVCYDSVFDIFKSLFKGIALSVASWESGTVYIKTIFGFIYDNSIFHVINLPYALSPVKKVPSWEGCTQYSPLGRGVGVGHEV